jgi:low affinity Fe/Cu permease
MSFTRFSAFVSRWTGRPEVFVLAVATVVLWAVSGPIFGFSEAWQLIINTATTVVTFLMVFIIQASQNRDTAALHVKLDELIRATKDAKNALLDVDDLTEDELRALRKNYARLAHVAESDPDSMAEGRRTLVTTSRSAERTK